ncbi:MAG: DUF4058 family protein [Anaerolineae bacterium]
MPTPFPGMDPYLERPSLWPNVHSSLIIAIRDELAPLLRPHYYVAVEERTVGVGPDDLLFALRPDVAVVRSPSSESGTATSGEPGHIVRVAVPMPEQVRETYLEIRETRGDQVITVLEILSPTNKLPGEGRRQYEQKRLTLLGTRTHVVEIDLLRSGQPMPILGYSGASDYRILVSRAEKRPLADLLPFSVREPIPTFYVPLRAGADEPQLDLNRLLHALYDRAGYDLRVDYAAPPDPALSDADATWAAAIVQERRTGI